MKALTGMCPNSAGAGASLTAIATGRVQRHREGENDEIKLYLSKLRELVPSMPKNRKLTKLEVIQNVIDYICDLQNALNSHPSANSFDPLVALQQHQQPIGYTAMVEPIDTATSAASRQPLGVRAAPNTILPSGGNNTGGSFLGVIG
ncbi:protein extra-macrochaetae-like, partial [Anopheles nili]|uniref:protein extra-macrochaetae-like n=1 Tax=Anopheles nili TaxID=185578 RepID=UPI00237AB6C1